MMSILKKPEFPIIIAFFIGMFITFEYFIYIPTWRNIVTEFQKWGTMLVTFALTIGSINVLSLHSNKIREKRDGWYNSVILILCFIGMMALGLYATFFREEGLLFEPFMYIVQNVQWVIRISMFALCGFYVVSSAYRSFRVRNVDSGIILTSALLVMLGQAPIGEVIWNQFPTIAHWLNNIPAVAGSRAISIGGAIGSLSISIQVLLGYERGWLGRGGE